MWTCNCHFPGISREGHVRDNHENFSFCRELMEEGSCICLFLKKKSCYWSVFNSLSKEHLQQRQKEEHSFTFTPNLGLELCSTSQTPLSFDKISGELQKHNKEGTREKCHHHLQKTGECGGYWKSLALHFTMFILFHFKEVFLPWVAHWNKPGPSFYLKLVYAAPLQILWWEPWHSHGTHFLYLYKHYN